MARYIKNKASIFGLHNTVRLYTYWALILSMYISRLPVTPTQAVDEIKSLQVIESTIYSFIDDQNAEKRFLVP